MSGHQGMTFKQFQATRRDSHVAQENPHTSSAYSNAEAMSWDGEIRAYLNGAVILCVMHDGTCFFDDYKERFSGTFEEMERKLYEFASAEALDMDAPIFD